MIIGKWLLNETSGLIATDTSVSGVNGVLTNMAGNEWDTEIVDGGLEFDAIDDCIIIGDGSQFSFGAADAFSFIFTVKLKGSDYHTIFYKQDYADVSKGIGIFIDTNAKIQLQMNYNLNTKKGIILLSDSALSYSTEYRIAITYSGSGLGSGAKMYVNGLPFAATLNGAFDNTVVGRSIKNSIPLDFGAFRNNTGVPNTWIHSMKGWLSRIYLYDTELSPAKIFQDYFGVPAGTSGAGTPFIGIGNRL